MSAAAAMARDARPITAIAALWAALVVGAFVGIARYKATPGALPAAPQDWPADTTVHRSAGRPTLLMFAHPRCPCTRASLHELARISAATGHAAEVEVVFVGGSAAGPQASSDLVRLAQAIPGAELIYDSHGEEARRFASATSGEVQLFSADGMRRFAGGITSARGHEGESPGGDRLIALLSGQRSALSSAPVFGCKLFND